MGNLAVIEIDDLRMLMAEVVQTEVNKALTRYRNEENKATDLMINGEIFLTNQDVMKMLNVGLTALHTMRRDGKLPWLKKGKKVLYKKSDILEYLNSGYMTIDTNRNSQTNVS